MNLEIIILSEVSGKTENQISYDITYNMKSKKWHKWTYLQKRISDIKNKLVLPKGNRERDKLEFWD